MEPRRKSFIQSFVTGGRKKSFISPNAQRKSRVSLTADIIYNSMSRTKLRHAERLFEEDTDSPFACVGYVSAHLDAEDLLSLTLVSSTFKKAIQECIGEIADVQFPGSARRSKDPRASNMQTVGNSELEWLHILANEAKKRISRRNKLSFYLDQRKTLEVLIVTESKQNPLLSKPCEGSIVPPVKGTLLDCCYDLETGIRVALLVAENDVHATVWSFGYKQNMFHLLGWSVAGMNTPSGWGKMESLKEEIGVAISNVYVGFQRVWLLTVNGQVWVLGPQLSGFKSTSKSVWQIKTYKSIKGKKECLPPIHHLSVAANGVYMLGYGDFLYGVGYYVEKDMIIPAIAPEKSAVSTQSVDVLEMPIFQDAPVETTKKSKKKLLGERVRFVDVSQSDHHALALCRDGHVWAWGNDKSSGCVGKAFQLAGLSIMKPTVLDSVQAGVTWAIQLNEPEEAVEPPPQDFGRSRTRMATSPMPSVGTPKTNIGLNPAPDVAKSPQHLGTSPASNVQRSQIRLMSTPNTNLRMNSAEINSLLGGDNANASFCTTSSKIFESKCTHDGTVSGTVIRVFAQHMLSFLCMSDGAVFFIGKLGKQHVFSFTECIPPYFNRKRPQGFEELLERPCLSLSAEEPDSFTRIVKSPEGFCVAYTPLGKIFVSGHCPVPVNFMAAVKGDTRLILSIPQFKTQSEFFTCLSKFKKSG
eukprot:Platyproteum_vivax@DN1384_c0_g1_i1.p1